MVHLRFFSENLSAGLICQQFLLVVSVVDYVSLGMGCVLLVISPGGDG
jgi:hypothetical protein